MKDFIIVLDKERVDVELLLQNEKSLPEAMRQLNLSEAFVGLREDKTVAVCLIAKRKGYYDIVNLAVKEGPHAETLDHELLTYVLDYVRVQGGRFVETGAGNADIRRHEMLMRLGFRVVGVWGDHYYYDKQAALAEDAILNRDMIRYRVDLNEGGS